METTTRYKKLLVGPPIERSVPKGDDGQFKYIGSTEAAKMLGVSKPTIIKEALEGYINAHIRRGRYLFTRRDIEDYILRNMTCKTNIMKRISLKDHVSV